TSGATLNADIGGATAGTQFDQISSGGTITLGGATLVPSLFGGFVPTAGQTFTIIKNTGTSAIGGTFNYLSPNSNTLIPLADGAKFNLPGNVVDFQINYNVGATKDVVLTALTPAAATKFAVTPAIT